MISDYATFAQRFVLHCSNNLIKLYESNNKPWKVYGFHSSQFDFIRRQQSVLNDLKLITQSIVE